MDNATAQRRRIFDSYWQVWRAIREDYVSRNVDNVDGPFDTALTWAGSKWRLWDFDALADDIRISFDVAVNADDVARQIANIDNMAAHNRQMRTVLFGEDSAAPFGNGVELNKSEFEQNEVGLTEESDRRVDTGWIPLAFGAGILVIAAIAAREVAK